MTELDNSDSILSNVVILLDRPADRSKAYGELSTPPLGVVSHLFENIFSYSDKIASRSREVGETNPPCVQISNIISIRAHTQIKVGIDAIRYGRKALGKTNNSEEYNEEIFNRICTNAVKYYGKITPFEQIMIRHRRSWLPNNDYILINTPIAKVTISDYEWLFDLESSDLLVIMDG